MAGSVAHIIDNRLDEDGLLDEEVRIFIPRRFRVPKPQQNRLATEAQ